MKQMIFSRQRAGVTLLSVAALAAMATAQVTMTAKSTWGFNGDGWWAPGENGITYLTSTGDNQRSLAYNPVTNRVYVVNALSVRGLNASTGASEVLLNTTGITGGDRALNQIGVTSDGQIYGSNLRATMGSTTTFKVYRWANEAAATPTVAFDGNVRTGGRLGDSFDVSGSGSSVQIAAGYGSTGNGYVILNGGLTLSAQDYTVAGSTGGDFRLGLAFYDGDTVYGTQNATLAANGIRISSFSGAVAGLDGRLVLEDQNERAIDFVTVNGRTLMATVQSNSSRVRIYDITSNPTSGTLASVASANLTTAFNTNGNGTADLAFGAITGSSVSLYALNGNNGIQAFDLQVVPEPGTMIALGTGLAAIAARRRRKA